MSRIIIFAGTTEGRRLSERLCGQKIRHIVCVATEYGEQVLKSDPFAEVHRGRMDAEEMTAFFREQNAGVIVDATHPYAILASRNVQTASEAAGISCLRLKRDTGAESLHAYRAFPDTESCADFLEGTEGNILLTTGSKELHVFSSRETLKNRLIVRVLPGKESIAICEAEQIPGKRIIAMQGPFSEEMNLALIHQYQAVYLVTKASGKAGGFEEKLSAAEKTGITSCVILPGVVEEKGLTFEEVCRKLEVFAEDSLHAAEADSAESSGPEADSAQTIPVALIGCGMGQPGNLTLEAAGALQKAELVFGASRLLNSMKITQKKYPYYLAKDILPVLLEEKKPAAILFSGDSGFYSGARKMAEALRETVKEGQLQAEIRIYPGISSVSALAAAAGESWEDACILSIHGRGSSADWAQKVMASARSHRKTFLLLSGAKDLQEIGRLLHMEKDADQYRVIAGFSLAAPEEEILVLTPEECMQRSREGLYSIFIIHENPEENVITHGLPDEAFLRGKVPMTKEEVRTVSISRLHLKANSVVYDVGSGTGSIAVEIGRLSPDIQVYAIERKTEAVDLIRKNAENFGLYNVHLVRAEAPDGLAELPVPTHAFIGGSGGHMKEILSVLLEKNPRIRITANAVSFETLQELLMIEKEFPVDDFQITSLSAVRTRELGHYHMMQGENPVWICSFEGKKE